MAEIAMRRVGQSLVAVDPVSEEMLAAIPTNVELLVTVNTPRNVKQFRKAWVLAQKVSEACDWLFDRVDAMDWMLIKARHIRRIYDTRNEELIVIPKSIRWASLSQQDFTVIFDRIIHVVTTLIIPGLDEGALRAEIEAMVFDPNAPEPAKPAPKRRGRPPLQKISVIPPHDPESGEIINESPQPDESAPIPAQRKETAEPDNTSALPAATATSVPSAATVAAGTPKTLAEWDAWSRAWLAAALIDMSISDQDVTKRWNGEMKLRNDLGITTEDRKAVFDLYMATVERMRNRRK